MSPKYNQNYQLSQIEQQTLQVTENVVNGAKFLINEIRERSATMSDQNKRAAAEYVAGVRDALRERTNIGVQQANQIVLGKIRDLENELTSFDLVIDDAVGAFVEDADFEVKNLRKTVSNAESDNAAQTLDNVIRQVESEIRSMLVDVDQMYSFYGRYIGHIAEHFMKNATDRISIMLNAQRRYCDCTVADRINFCYNISAQNGEVSRNLESVIKTVNILHNTTDTVDGLIRIYVDADPHSRTVLAEAKNTLQKTTDEGRRTLDSILDDEYCFLGSTLRRYAYADHATLKEFMVRGMKTVIGSLSKSLRAAMDSFQVVKPVHHQNKLVVGVHEILETLVNDMKTKAALIPDARERSAYMDRANLGTLKELVKLKFENATAVVNGYFDDNRKRLAESLKYNLGYIVGQQLPYISTLTIQNYIPTDVCPLSVDFQKFISVSLRETLHKEDEDIINELFESANYYADDTETGSAIAANELIPSSSSYNNYDASAETNQEGGNSAGGAGAVATAKVDKNTAAESSATSSTFMNLINAIISSIHQAGYTVEEPVRVIVTRDE